MPSLDPADEPAPSEAAAQPVSPRRHFQFGLRGLLLVTALVAVWGTHYLNRRSIQHLQSRIAVLRAMAAELVVDDRSLITVVKRPQLWYDENIWDIYLPRADYQLHVATEAVDKDGVAPIDASVPLPQGRITVELRQERTDTGWRLTILLDEHEVIAVDKPAEWNAGIGSSGGGEFSAQEEKQATESVMLFRRRFMIPAGDGVGKTPDTPASGVLLWIEPGDEASSAAAAD